ncbi:hypothetical protein L484_021730 [Morus notabilis]|uniref:Uncharacterized protein n=1 Tax=Morus notabilis TaxID=981085 RepID=W9SKP7_9ROSA|nr:hypothetical protein L484_021730 [Morus notabilis]
MPCKTSSISIPDLYAIEELDCRKRQEPRGREGGREGGSNSLFLTYLGLYLMDGHGQPALLYLVPCTLGVTVVLGLIRGELKQLWNYGTEASGTEASPPSLSSETGITPIGGQTEKLWPLEVLSFSELQPESVPSFGGVDSHKTPIQTRLDESFLMSREMSKMDAGILAKAWWSCTVKGKERE